MTRHLLLLTGVASFGLLFSTSRPSAGETRPGPLVWTQARLIKLVLTGDGALCTVYARGKKLDVKIPDSATVMLRGRKSSASDLAPGSEVWLQVLSNRPDSVVRAGDAYSYVIHLRRRSFDAKVVEVTPTTCTLESADGVRSTRRLVSNCTFWGPDGELKAAQGLLDRRVRVFIGEGAETVEALADLEGLGFYVLNVVQTNEVPKPK